MKELTGLCKNKGRVNEGKARMIMKCEGTPAALYGGEVWGARSKYRRVRRRFSAPVRKFLLEP